MPNADQKILIIRFSSLGDIAQSFAAAELLTNRFSEVHWVTRSDFADFVAQTPAVSKVFALRRADGFRGLLKLAQVLRTEKYNYIYDAHSNVRSHLLSFLLWRPGLHIIRRSKERWKRFLLFRLRKNTFTDRPYRGARSFVRPLAHLVSIPQILPTVRWRSIESRNGASELVLLAPSAAWDLKKWPTEYWQELIQLLPETQFGLLGGPDDDFTNIVSTAPGRIQDFSGKMNWSQTSQAIHDCKLLVSGDTGALHIADNFNKKAIALIGPTAFGFPSRPNSAVMEIELWCRPCTKDGRGKCINQEFKKCLKDVRPQAVAAKIQEYLA